MRTHYDAPVPQIKLAEIKDTNSITLIREYQLITPLFGGGVEAGKNDSITPIRGTAIRGQLRFWWRACRGGKAEFEGQLAKMQEAEARIWGTATLTKKQNHQKVQDIIQIRVEIIQPGEAKKPFLLNIDEKRRDKNNVPKRTPKENRDTRIHSYAAFPLQPPEKELTAIAEPILKTVQENISFRLIITFPKRIERKVNDEIITEEITPEVEAALWAWETFGGVGARTRRGFGALKCIRLLENDQVQTLDIAPAQPSQAQEWLQKHVQIHRATGTWPKYVPHLHKDLVARQNFYLLESKQQKHLAKESWYRLIDCLKDFRQMRRGNQYGRSLWPEPDIIRTLSGKPPLNHRWKRNIFPRAAFGLPIIFHFQRPQPNNKNDPANRQPPRIEPEDTTLQVSEKEERMASPLILRPLACQDNNYLGLALVLAGYDIPHPRSNIILQKQKSRGNTTRGQQLFNVIAQINKDEAEMIEPLSGNTNVLEAFLKSIQ